MSTLFLLCQSCGKESANKEVGQAKSFPLQNPTSNLVDMAHIFSEEDDQHLSQLLKSITDSQSIKGQILILRSPEQTFPGERPTEIAEQVAEQWDLDLLYLMTLDQAGKAQITIAKSDKVKLTDLELSIVCQKVITPLLNQQKYSAGLWRGLKATHSAFKNEEHWKEQYGLGELIRARIHQQRGKMADKIEEGEGPIGLDTFLHGFTPFALIIFLMLAWLLAEYRATSLGRLIKRVVGSMLLGALGTWLLIRFQIRPIFLGLGALTATLMALAPRRYFARLTPLSSWIHSKLNP